MVHFGIWLIWVRCVVYTINSNNKMIAKLAMRRKCLIVHFVIKYIIIFKNVIIEYF